MKVYIVITDFDNYEDSYQNTELITFDHEKAIQLKKSIDDKVKEFRSIGTKSAKNIMEQNIINKKLSSIYNFNSCDIEEYELDKNYNEIFKNIES